MRATIGLADMARLPWPDHEQIEAFIAHVCWAHSWYKHLPFDDSARFVVFLAVDAGGGFETRERLHHGWKTTAEYRARYGLLDYAWRLPADEEWSRDAGGPVEPTEELVALVGFALGPTCSSDQNAVEVICRLWSDEAGFEDAEARALSSGSTSCSGAGRTHTRRSTPRSGTRSPARISAIRRPPTIERCSRARASSNTAPTTAA